MSILLQVNTTKGLVNVLLNGEKQYSTRCRILGIRAKCYGFGGAFTPKFISPQAIETAYSLGYDLATEEGMQAVLRDKEKIRTAFDPSGKLPQTKPIGYYFSEKKVHKKWWFWPGVGAYMLIMILALRACVGPRSNIGASSVEDIKKEIVGVYTTTDKSTEEFGIVNTYRYVIKEDGTYDFDASTNGGPYKNLTSGKYTVGKGKWADSNKPRWFVTLRGDDYNFVDDCLAFKGYFPDGSPRIETYVKQ